MTRDDGFLNRWSRRKLKPQEHVSDDIAVDPVVEAPAEPEVQRTEEEVLEELGLRDPDELEPGDDFSGFMGKAVPERLRNRALRKLWLTNPVLANLDDLVDYGDDFTDAATVVENLQTIYRVGQGMIDRSVDPEKEAEDAVPGTVDTMNEGGDQDSDSQNEDAFAESSERTPDGDAAHDADAEAGMLKHDGEKDRIAEVPEALERSNFPPPRRMAFRFDEG